MFVEKGPDYGADNNKYSKEDDGRNDKFPEIASEVAAPRIEQSEPCEDECNASQK